MVLSVPDGFCYAEHVFEECFGAQRHAEAQEMSFSRIECTREVFRPPNHVFEDYFGAPRRVDAEETISSSIIVCSMV